MRQMQQRTFDRMVTGFAALLLTVAPAMHLGMRAEAQAAPPRFPITSSQIVAAMESSQLPVGEVEIQLAAPMTTSVATPQLEIQTVALLGPHSVQMRLGCHVRAQCTPFYATATWPLDSAALSAPPVPHLHAGRDAGPIAGPAANRFHGAAAPSPGSLVALSRGTTATLLLDGERVHIRLAVVCLESGIQGDSVRVTTPDRKHAYIAEVVTSTLLKGSL